MHGQDSGGEHTRLIHWRVQSESRGKYNASVFTCTCGASRSSSSKSL
jgi:hypothetical protein